LGICDSPSDLRKGTVNVGWLKAAFCGSKIIALGDGNFLKR
jgi:hypothetical protein